MSGASLAGRVALITGASDGLGRAFALRVAELGGSVIACSRPTKNFLPLAAGLPDSIDSLAVDLLEAGASAIIAEVLAKRGRLDILVNNVGGPLPPGSFEMLTDEDWIRTFELTFFVAVRITRVALPYLRRSPAGRILNVGSPSAFEPHRNSPHYSSAKAALHTFSKYLATELGPDGITVNVLAPGRFHSRGRADAIRRRAQEKCVPESLILDEFAARDKADFPLGRAPTAEEIARAATFLLTDEAACITGSTFVVDGGFVRSVR